VSSRVLNEKAPAAVEKTTDSTRSSSGWKTVLFNCNCHTFHEVALQLTKAIRCTYEKGMHYANLVHYTGCAVVYSGARERCEAVAGILEDIGLRVKVEQ